MYCALTTSVVDVMASVVYLDDFMCQWLASVVSSSCRPGRPIISCLYLHVVCIDNLGG